MCLLSIIIPIYNMEEYLQECLLSLKRQSFDDDVEIILVDDGSTDSSLEICQEVASRESNYYVIQQENQGVSTARNTGLANAKGKYVAWIDPDDYITDDWYTTVKKELSSSPDMIYFDMYTLTGNKLQKVSFDRYSRTLSKQELCEELAVGNRIQSHLWSKIIRRSFFEQPFSTKYSYCEDFAVLHHVCWHAKECRYIHKPLYVYRQVETSITNDEEKMLSNAIVGIRLYKHRYRFYIKHNMKVSKAGIYLAMLWFCYCYTIVNKSSAEPYARIYNICFGLTRENIWELLSSANIPIKRKIKVCGIILVGNRFYKTIKRLMLK